MTTVKLHCPNFWGFGRVYQSILQTPNVFKRENTEIYSAYGCFPGMIWNGGRPQDHNKTSLERITKEFEIYHTKLHIPIELTLNNMILTEEDLKDPYCNSICKIAEKYNTVCIVTSKLLKQYLEDKYPKLKLTRSCIACEDGHDYDDKNEYYMSVLNQFEGGNLELLNNIPYEKRKYIELVADVECKDGCKLFYIHHRAMAECQKFNNSDITFKCPLGEYYMPIYHARLQNHYISPEKAQEYINFGYEHFKLLSRCNIGQAIHEICDYIFKPEYVPDMVAKCYIMLGVPLKVNQFVDYEFYLHEDFMKEAENL